MSQAQNVQILDKVIFVEPDISMITGGFKMTAEDLGIDKTLLPPDGLASLGRMYFIDPKYIKEGTRIKNRVLATFKKYGLGRKTGFILTPRELNKAQQEVDQYEVDFNQWKQKLIEKFDTNVKDWIEQHPDYAKVIKKHIQDKSYIAKQVNFNIDYAQYAASVDVDIEAVKQSNYARVNSLPQCAFDEATDFVSGIIKRSLDNQSFSIKSINNIKNKLIPKLTTYQFLSDDVVLLIQYLESVCIEADKVFNSNSSKQIVDEDYQWLLSVLQPISEIQSLNDTLSSIKGVSPSSSVPTLF